MAQGFSKAITAITEFTFRSHLNQLHNINITAKKIPPKLHKMYFRIKELDAS